MIAVILAAAAVAAGPVPVSGPGPDYKPPQWVKKPTSDDLAGTFPMAARDFPGGHVVMDCEVSVLGEPEDCRIVFEDPPGLDFGWAAAKMRALFHFRPATRAGRPVTSRITIPINFQREGIPPPAPIKTTPITLVNHPVWAAAPSFADIGAAYPNGAVRGPVDVHLRCAVDAGGSLSGCRGEDQIDPSFTKAAIRLSAKFRMITDPEALSLGKPLKVELIIRLTDPTSPEFASRRLGPPTWIAGFDPAVAQKLFPPEAAAKGLTNGLGRAHCVVAADGALTGCTALPGDPDGLGFSEAAVKLASAMKMNPWTAEGGPVDGVTVNLPIRFKLAAAKPGP